MTYHHCQQDVAEAPNEERRQRSPTYRRPGHLYPEERINEHHHSRHVEPESQHRKHPEQPLVTARVALNSHQRLQQLIHHKTARERPHPHVRQRPQRHVARVCQLPFQRRKQVALQCTFVPVLEVPLIKERVPAQTVAQTGYQHQHQTHRPVGNALHTVIALLAVKNERENQRQYYEYEVHQTLTTTREFGFSMPNTSRLASPKSTLHT